LGVELGAMRIRLIAVLGAALLQLALPAFAKADDLIGVASRPTPISAYAGRLAWSAYNPATNSYSLMTSIGGVTSVVPVSPRSVPFDVDLGPDFQCPYPPLIRPYPAIFGAGPSPPGAAYRSPSDNLC
jgi:hypothetical protein